MSNKTTIILDRQSLFDIALSEFGSMETVFSIMAQNKVATKNLTYFPMPGTRLHTNGSVSNPVLTSLYTQLNHKPVSLFDYNELATSGDYNNDYNNDYN